MARALPKISLEQYAGIRAAVADGHALEAVLAQEGVPAWRWPQLDLEYTDAVTSDPALFEHYCAKLAQAEDVLTRGVAPLDADVGAWCGFVSASSADPELVQRHGLLPGDLKRLQRGWQQRFDADPRLKAHAQKLAAQPPAPPDALELEPATLQRFPWSPGAAQAEEARSLEPLAFLAETAPTARKPKGPATPFAGYRPPPPGTLAIEYTSMLGETAPLPNRGRMPVAATPFEPPIPIEPPRSVDPPPAQGAAAVAMPKRSRLEPNALLAATALGARRPNEPALPFSGQRPAPAPIAHTLEPVAGLGQTAPIAGTKNQSPFAHWTPEHYGWFCAELDATPSDRRQVLARWGLADEPQRQALERHWLERFRADPRIRDRFAAAIQQARNRR